MNIVDVVKKQDYFRQMEIKKEENSLSNAILFFCEDQYTSKTVLTLASLMLQYGPMYELFNEESAEFLKIVNGIDLDTKIYPKNGEKLLVGDSNEIVAEAYIKPVNMPYKIFVVNNFDVSTEEAQNKLLKIIEEPPKNVYFLMSAKSEEKVLATIRSRCDKIKIPPLSTDEMSQYFSDNLAVILGNGYIGKTLELQKNDELKAIVDFSVSLFTELKSSKNVIKFSKNFIERKNELDLILQVMTLCIEDIIKLKCESESLCKLTPYTNSLKDVEPEFSVEALCEISNLIYKLREKIDFNANISIAIDNFLLKILEVKYLCK